MEDVETAICLDTGIVLDILRKKEETITWLKANPDAKIAITLITLFELYRGVYLGSHIDNELKDIEEVKERVFVLPLTEAHMRSAAQVSVDLQKKGITIDIRDLLIGICAKEEGYSIKTRNQKHFTNIPELKLIN